MKKLPLLFIIGIIFFVIQPHKALAGATLTIVPPKTVNMGTVSVNDYEAGYKEKIRANVLLVRDTDNDWKLMIRTNDSNMGVIGDYAKPIRDLNWRASGYGATQLTYTSLTNYDVELARGPKGSPTRLVYADYKILLAWANDLPGVYNITILYTLTTQ